MSSKSAPGAGTDRLPEWCGWEAVWLAEALAARLSGARAARVRRVPGGGLLLVFDTPRETLPLVFVSAGRGASLLVAP